MKAYGQAMKKVWSDFARGCFHGIRFRSTDFPSFTDKISKH